MNQERQKTDTIADAVEIPEGATHFMHPFYFKKGKKAGCFSTRKDGMATMEPLDMKI